MWLLQLLSWLFEVVAWLLRGNWLDPLPGPTRVTKDIIQLIHDDHGRVRCLCHQYCMAGNTTHQKQLLALDIIRHSSMHSKKEDMVLTPALATYTGAQGAGLTAAQHQHLEVQLQELLHVPVTHPHYDIMMAQYMQDCEGHLQEEERVLLPGLQEELSQQQLMQLGRLFEWAKLIAPSRPHPWAPKAPIECHIANAMLTPLDFCRDLLAFEGAPTL